MNAFQKCPNTTDAVPLYLPQHLYLKPIARISVSVQLAQKMLGKTITHHELMQKLRELIRPDEFTLLRVTKMTLEIIRFEAEVEHKNLLHRVKSKLDNKLIKLKNFEELLKVKASEAKSDFATKHSWDSFFRDAKDMNEMKPGERPDTVHMSNLPTKWFVPHHLQHEEELLPSEKILYSVFEKFGKIRNIDIPICDPYRSKMKSHMTGFQMSSLDDKDFFEGYIQFKDYIGFSKCMDALRNMKLLHRGVHEDLMINISVDFDKSKHLSEASIKRRSIVRDRLIFKQKEKEVKENEAKKEEELKELADKQKEIQLKNEKEKRRREREEKRKAKIMAELKVKGSDDINEKIAKEEKKLMKIQRRLEAIRLVEELFRRIKTKTESGARSSRREGSKDNKLTKIKAKAECQIQAQRDKLHDAVEGRVILKSIVSSTKSRDEDSSSDSSSPQRIGPEEHHDMHALHDWYNYMQNAAYSAQFYNSRSHPYYFGRGRMNAPGPSRRPAYYSRPYNGRGRGRMNHLMQQEYYKYMQMYNRPHDQRRSRSRSRLRSRTPSRHRSYSRSPSKHRSRSYSSHRSSRSRNRSKNRSRSRTKNRSRSRTKSHSTNHSTKNRSKSRSAVRSQSRSRGRRSRSWTDERSRSRGRNRFKNRSKSKNRTSYSRSRSRERSQSVTRTPHRSKSKSE